MYYYHLDQVTFSLCLIAFEVLQWMSHADKPYLHVALYSRSSVNHLKMATRKCFRTCYETNAGRLLSVAESIVLGEIVTADNPYVRSV